VFQTCPTTETTNQKTVFQPGEAIFTAAYYRDQLIGQQTQYSLLRPDGTAQQTWSGTSSQNYDASYWWWSWTLPANAPNGIWKLRAVYDSVTYDTPFQVGQLATFANISGRVTTPGGLGLRNAVVSLIDPDGVRRNSTTSSFGIYSFNNVATGTLYTVTVASKRYRFTPLSQQFGGNLSNLDFVGLE